MTYAIGAKVKIKLKHGIPNATEGNEHEAIVITYDTESQKYVVSVVGSETFRVDESFLST